MGGRTTTVNVEGLDEAQLRALVPDLLTQLAAQQKQIAELQRMLFGRRSEKSRYLDETNLLPFAQDAVEELRVEAKAAEEEAATVHVPAHDRKPSKRRREFPEHLPRHRTTYEVTGDALLCPCCGKPRRPFGEEVSQELERLEISFVHEMVQVKYSCADCEGHVVVAERPPRVIEKGILGPGFLAQILFDRFSNHMPYARLEKKYGAEGLSLSRSVLCTSAMRCAELLKPVFDAHVDEVLQSLQTSVLQVDDTFGTQRNGRQAGQKKIHVWAWRDQHAGVFFTASDSRNRGSPGEILGARGGRLQCDGHDCYEDLDADSITRIGCWAHLRRYFEKAKKLGDPTADKPLDWIGKLFVVEREAKKGRDNRPLTDAEVAELRARKSLPITKALKAWLENAHVEQPGLPKGPLMEGIRYGLNQWSTLERFLTDGRIREISNNGCERALRAVVLGRKNWLFFGSEEGTEASLILMSLVQSCREHGISPLLYLRDVLHAVSVTPASRVADLTPLGWIRSHEKRVRSAAATATIDAVVGSLFCRSGAS